MRLDLTDDQQFFQETLRRFVEQETPMSAVRERIDAVEAFDPAWWRAAVELGAASFLVPESAGGGSISGLGAADLAIVAEEFGRHVLPSPLVPVNVVAETLARHGGHPDRLASIMAGESVATWVGDPDRGPDARPPIHATRDTDGFVLAGEAVAVEAADQADQLLVTASTDAGSTQFLVTSDAEGVTITRQASLDLLRHFGRVRLDDVRVSGDDVVGEVGGADDDVHRQRLVAVVLQCAESCGAAARVLEFTIEWGFDRYSFGRPLASYQALKHRYADMKLWIEAAHAITDEAAVAVSSGGSPELVHAAKAYVGDRTVELIQDCVQLHGGIGVTWEHDIHLYLRRATVNRGLFGDPNAHREILASGLGI